ncbi:MAG TPA: hypothetical protein VJT74_10385 [Pyrinomonadaceae bacterium]|nr:hypothetical protein [Pyrinomonadaceae bacterium]
MSNKGGGPPNVLTSPDGRFQLTVPGDWRKETQLNEQASIQASNRVRETYVVLLSESKSDFTDEMSLERFTSLTRGNMMAGVRSAESAEPQPTNVSGNPALQYEIRGGVEGLNVVYIITTVETPEHYHQIITWTLPSRLEQHRPTLLDVTRSFKELRPADSQPGATAAPTPHTHARESGASKP